MQSLSELIDETPPDRLRDNASPAEKMLRASATAEEAPPTAPPRRIAPSTQDALEAAEHGDARALAAYLENGGDPAATSRLHHMGWSLLHLAAGCALAGGPGAAQAYRRRPEPDAPGGFARCVELLLAAGAEPAPGDERPAPLAGAVLCGDAASARLLLRAGAAAPTEVEAPPGRHTAAEREAMRELLNAPPKLLPRSPLRVEAKLSEYVEGDARERVVEVRWRPPPPAPGVGPVERYVVRGRAVAGGSTNADAAVEFAVGVCFLRPVSFCLRPSVAVAEPTGLACCLSEDSRTTRIDAGRARARRRPPAAAARLLRERGRRPRRGAAPAPQPAAAALPVDARPRPRARDDVPLRRELRLRRRRRAPGVASIITVAPLGGARRPSLCGNQISGAPRRRRNVVVSLHLRDGVELPT